jgi:hypothetical protein
VTSTPPKPSLLKSTALAQATAVANRLNSLLPTVPSAESPVTVYQAGTIGVGGQLSAPTSVFPVGTGYYGVWTAPDLNDGKPYTMQVECFGGGGGGGGGSSTSGGGGGGGAEYARETSYPVKPGVNYVYVVGVPGSAGTANNDDNQGATAGGTGGLTVFDIAGSGVAGGVQANGGQGGDVGNTGIGGNGGLGSFNTTEFQGGPGGTNLPGGGGGSGGQGGTDNPIALLNAGLLSSPPVAWYLMNDASSNGQLNDNSGDDNPANPGSYGGGGLAYGQPGAPSQVPAYVSPGNPPSSPNPTTAGTQLRFVLAQLNQQSGYALCPGFAFSGHQVTVSGWVTPDPTGTWGNTATGSRAVIATNCTGYANSSTAGVALYFKNSGTSAHPSWTLNFYCASSGSHQTVSVSVPPVANTPVYVAATFSSGAMTVYVNGTSAGTATAGFSSLPGFPTVPFGVTLGADPRITTDWFFGYMSNLWFSPGVLSSAGVTQAFSGSGGSSTEGGAGGGASGGPAALGGAGAAGSGSTGGAGGTPATQPATDVGLNTPASAGIAGAAGNAGNPGITGAAGAGGGGAGSSTSPPNIVTVQVPFVTAASYCGTDATGGSAGTVYNPVIQGATGRLFTGGQSQDAASGSKNSLLVLPPSLAASLQPGSFTVLRVTLTVTSANPQAAQNALMQVGWAADTFLPITYDASDTAGSAGVVEIPAGAFTVTADLTESQLGAFLQNGGAKALVLGPGPSPTFAAYNSDTAADFYTAVYGPGAVDSAGNSLAPFLTVTYAQSTTVQQGSPGGAGAVLLTFLNQAQTLVGNWTAADGINASGGQLTETTVVLGSTLQDAARMNAIREQVRAEVKAENRAMIREAMARLGSVPGAPGTLLGYTAGMTTVTQTTPGTYTFTVPSDVTSLSVACWGAGAGATGGSTSQGQGGGGGGAYAGEPNYNAAPGDVLTYIVGAGGAGDHVGSNNSPDGGFSAFDTLNIDGPGVLANGGQHYSSSRNFGPGGTTSGNTVSFAGGNGGPLNSGQNNGSGGGGSAGAGGNGGGGNSGVTGGHAGSGGGAAGGAGSTNGSGSGGSAPGAGGGGASQGTSAFTGGSGANGKVVITYVSSTALATSIATASGSDAAGNPYPTGIGTTELAVSGTTTTANQMVSNTTTTNVLAVTTNATVGGNHTVTGNVAVGGVITGPSGGTLESSSGVHVAGATLIDGGLTVSSTGASISGGTDTDSLTVSGGSTTELAAGLHAGGAILADGGLTSTTIVTANGSGTSEYTGGIHAGGAVQADGGFIGPAIPGFPVSMGVTIGTVSGSGSNVIATGGLVNLLNAINSALT